MKIIYISFLILLSTVSPAAFLNDYAALKQTDNFSESHYISYADVITGKGGGLFSWIPNDVKQEAWGLIIKSDRNKQGSWIRQDVTELHSEWFGAINKKKPPFEHPTFRAFGYSQEEITRRYSPYIKNISLDDTPDWAAVEMMCRLQEAGWHSIALSSDDFYISRPVTLAEPVKAVNSIHYQLEGNGCTFISTASRGFTFLYTMPDNQKESVDVFCSRRFTIKNFTFKGSNKVANDVGIAIGGSFHSLIENIQFTNLDTGLILRHSMSTIVTRCNAVACTGVAYYVGSGRGAWLNANNTNSGSNQTKITSCRIFSADRQYAGVQIVESSECRVEDFTIDGGAKRHTAYGIYIDNGGSTTVKDAFVKGIHGESAIDSALVKFRGNGDALFEVSDVYLQYQCTVVELDVINGYAQVTCSGFSYLPNGSNFANRGNGGRWLFMNAINRSKEVEWKTGNGYKAPNVKQFRNDKKL